MVLNGKIKNTLANMLNLFIYCKHVEKLYLQFTKHYFLLALINVGWKNEAHKKGN